MANSQKDKTQSPLVAAVLALDDGLAEMERLGAKIHSLDLKSETDQQYLRRLLEHFAACSKEVSTGVVDLSTHLNEARVRAETAASQVAARTNELKNQSGDQQKWYDEFVALTEKVAQLNSEITSVGQTAGSGESLSDEDRNKITSKLREVQTQLDPLIEEAEKIKNHAHESRMKTLESKADSLTQSLQSVRHRLSSVGLDARM